MNRDLKRLMLLLATFIVTMAFPDALPQMKSHSNLKISGFDYSIPRPGLEISADNIFVSDMNIVIKTGSLQQIVELHDLEFLHIIVTPHDPPRRPQTGTASKHEGFRIGEKKFYIGYASGKQSNIYLQLKQRYAGKINVEFFYENSKGFRGSEKILDLVARKISQNTMDCRFSSGSFSSKSSSTFDQNGREIKQLIDVDLEKLGTECENMDEVLIRAIYPKLGFEEQFRRKLYVIEDLPIYTCTPVQLVFIAHSHVDRIGGNIEDSYGQPTLKNMTIFPQFEEDSFGIKKILRSKDEFKLMIKHDNVRSECLGKISAHFTIVNNESIDESGRNIVKKFKVINLSGPRTILSVRRDEISDSSIARSLFRPKSSLKNFQLKIKVTFLDLNDRSTTLQHTITLQSVPKDSIVESAGKSGHYVAKSDAVRQYDYFSLSQILEVNLPLLLNDEDITTEGFSDSNDGQNPHSESVNNATRWTIDDWRNFAMIILLLSALVFLLIYCRNNFFSKSSPNILSHHPTNSNKGSSENFIKLDDGLSVNSNNADFLAKNKHIDDHKEIKRGPSIEYPDDRHHLAIKSINTNQRRDNVKVNPIMSLDQIEKKIVTEIRDYKLLDSSEDEIPFEYLEKYYKYFLSYSDQFKKNLPIFEFAKSLSNDSIRYTENGCYKHSKVELKGVPGLEINANYIPDRYGNKRFIATEAPKNELACAAFWHMIYEKRCEIVVSLVDIFDVATSGCDYMPEIGKTRSFKGLEVSIVENSSSSDNSKRLGLYFNSRTLRIRNSETGDLQVIKHLQFAEYPDKLQPEHPAIAQHFIDFLDDYMRIRQSPNSGESGQSMKPIVVHCLAGLNRSMWLISSVTLLNEMRRKGQLLCDPLSQMVFEAQMRRNCISDGQTFFFTYSFLRNAMDIEAMQLRGMASIRRTLSENMRQSSDASLRFIRKLEKLIVCEFSQHLEAFRRRNNSEKYIGSPLSVLISDNEDKSDETDQDEPFLNASKIPGETKNDFILAQYPQKSRQNHFWKAVCEKNCTTITLLNDMESSEIDENIDDILPTENSPIVLKKFLIYLVSTKTRFNGKLLEKTLRVTDLSIQKFQFEIKVFVVTNINIQSFCNPENLEFIIQAIYPQYAMEFESDAMKIKMTIVDQKGAACATQLALLLTFINHLPKISRIKPFHSISLVALLQSINCKRPKFFESTEKLTAIIGNLHRLIEQHS